jgi:type IV pilus assembly protein PilX
MNYQNTHHHQKGVVLVIGLLMLIVLTLIGITGMKMTTFEEKMAGNTKDKNAAFQAAEAALMAAETNIENNIITTGIFDTDGTDGFYDDSNEKIWNLVDWEGTDSGNDNEAIVYSAFNSTYKVTTSPKYVIEHYASVMDAVDSLNLDNYGSGTGAGVTEMFRITARGTGLNDNTTVLLQTTYGKRL